MEGLIVGHYYKFVIEDGNVYMTSLWESFKETPIQKCIKCEKKIGTYDHDNWEVQFENTEQDVWSKKHFSDVIDYTIERQEDFIKSSPDYNFEDFEGVEF